MRALSNLFSMILGILAIVMLAAPSFTGVAAPPWMIALAFGLLLNAGLHAILSVSHAIADHTRELIADRDKGSRR